MGAEGRREGSQTGNVCSSEYNRNTSNICSALHRVYVTSNTVSSSRIRTTKRQASRPTGLIDSVHSQ